jgi:glycosyltransferase involved in cell wall biosynthesis
MAYQAEGTIRRAIDSIVGQTYANWQYFVFNNGSTDGTKEIIEQYVERDSRMHIISGEQNEPWRWFEIVLKCMSTDSFGFYAQLDADDEYSAEFLEKTVSVQRETGCDTVSVSSINIDSQNAQNTYFTHRMAKTEFFTTPNDWEDLPRYYSFFTSSWGHLIKSGIILQMDANKTHSGRLSYDYLAGFERLLYTNTAVALPDIMHKRWIRANSFGRTLTEARLKREALVADASLAYCKKKLGYVSYRNSDCIFLNYITSLRQTLEMLRASAIFDNTRKIEYVRSLICSEHFAAIERPDFGLRLREPETAKNARFMLFRDISHMLGQPDAQ